VSAELSKCYEVLGVKPGLSPQELKAAHRDLAKVWHPDRFVQDPLLQQKAQEKLKEINQAYHQLISQSTRRRGSPAPTRVRTDPDTRSQHFYPAEVPIKNQSTVDAARPGQLLKILLTVLIFGVAFLFTARSLMRQHPEHGLDSNAQTEEVGSKRDNGQSLTSGLMDNGASRIKNRSDFESSEPRSGDLTVEQVSEPLRPLPTVTVWVDGETGLLATGNCPNKVRMTYPSGNEPHEYCKALHPAQILPAPAQPKESRIKSIAKRVSSPSKWIKGKTDTDNNQNQ
jgi:DnaJ domain